GKIERGWNHYRIPNLIAVYGKVNKSLQPRYKGQAVSSRAYQACVYLSVFSKIGG
ncbi:hypothetical protein CMV_028001, partial [Castanea mollissima]